MAAPAIIPANHFTYDMKGGTGCRRRPEKRRSAPPSAFGSPELVLGDGLRSATLLRQVPVLLRSTVPSRRPFAGTEMFFLLAEEDRILLIPKL